MSYPSHGFEKLYRNSIDNVSKLTLLYSIILTFFLQVANFLNKKHGEKYHIINTSERATYDA